eukprot:bmy_02530T0
MMTIRGIWVVYDEYVFGALRMDVPAISASAVLTCHTAPVSGRKLRTDALELIKASCVVTSSLVSSVL